MTNPEDNRFEDFFNDPFYVSLKNSLYNYRIRRSAVRKCVRHDTKARILEVGSGLSPMLAGSSRVVYSDLSFSALTSLRRIQKEGSYVEADALSLPFQTGSFSTVVCSEVLEHIPDDLQALKEIKRVMAETGTLILTFPHRRSYFAMDDRFVHHVRRYDIADMEEKLRDAGLEVSNIRKVLGPLEKITMISVIYFASTFFRSKKGAADTKKNDFFLRQIIAPVFKFLNFFYGFLAWLDARIFPRGLASVILVTAKKRL